ncbi:NIPSNAP family protein [Mucilaginibacter sp.]|uniref:NIPSNAP family protein n=1 Tax=Mucilaginibacter sp. TaxID=1882438 RepID=UPI003D0B5CAC
MDQLRIYTLADKETAVQYFTVSWAKHRINLPKFGFEVKGVCGHAPGNANQVIPIVSFPDESDPHEMTERYLKSPDFAVDTAGFDLNKIINVETKILRSTI